MLTDGEKIKERWRKYYTALLNKENQRDELEYTPPVEGPIEELTRKEIKDAIKAMKKGKAAGCSGVSADIIKNTGGERSRHYGRHHRNSLGRR